MLKSHHLPHKSTCVDKDPSTPNKKPPSTPKKTLGNYHNSTNSSTSWAACEWPSSWTLRHQTIQQKPNSNGESNTNKKAKAASDEIEPEEQRAMMKEFLAMTKLYSSSSEDENFTFSPVLLALNLHIIAKMIGPDSEAENGRRELEWLLGSACDVVVPKLLRGFLSDVGNGIGFDLKFWFVDFNRLHQGMEGLRRCFAKAVAVAPRRYTRGHVDESAAVEDVNHWVKFGTSHLIDKVLPDLPLAGKAALLAANLLYFKGTWVEKFDESDTKEYDFYLRDRR